jgi:hypothetical protein
MYVWANDLIDFFGGGHNGLTFAAYLAKAGASILAAKRREELVLFRQKVPYNPLSCAWLVMCV